VRSARGPHPARAVVAAGVMARPFAPRCRAPVLILMRHVAT
jgi:hypothetical protein